MGTTLKTKRYEVTLTGKTALLMHKDNIVFSEALNKWRKDPQNKKTSVAGDDRSPAWTWIGYCYADPISKKLILDSDNIMTMLREAGAKFPTGKGKQTYKSVTQYGLQVMDGGFEFFNNGEPVTTDWINELNGDNDFDKHLAAVEKHGFLLNMKRAKIGSGARATKHIRVRPQFDNWTARGVVQIVDEDSTGLKQDVLQRLFDIAGDIIGIGDWRPSCASAGPYGRFKASVELIK